MLCVHLRRQWWMILCCHSCFCCEIGYAYQAFCHVAMYWAHWRDDADGHLRLRRRFLDRSLIISHVLLPARFFNPCNLMKQSSTLCRSYLTIPSLVSGSCVVECAHRLHLSVYLALRLV